MKHFSLRICTLLILIFFMACRANKTPALQAIPFNFPDDIAEADKPLFVKNFNKGHILYNINCAKCHNKIEDGREVIPTFSLPQLMDYEIRIQYPSHQDPMRETNVSAEELEQIITFLRYKRSQ